MTIEAMKQALETLKENVVWFSTDTMIGRSLKEKTDKAITSLRQVIEQAEKQEPVAWLSRRYVDNFPASGYETAQPTDYGEFPVYTTPQPQREWVGLTDEEIAEGIKQSWVTEQAFQSAAWWAEERLKEKNK